MGVNFLEASTGAITVPAQGTMNGIHFCAGVSSNRDRWHGDWKQVRRFDFSPLELEYTDFSTPLTDCLYYGLKCEGEPVLLALIWRTREMIPWDESILPTPIPTLTPTPGGERG